MDLTYIKIKFIEDPYFRTAVKAVTIIIVATFLNFFFSYIFKKRISQIKKIKHQEEKKMRITRINFLKNIVSMSIFIITILFLLFLIPGFEKIAYSLLAGAGIAAIIIGFAAQKTLSNIVSGLSIITFTPFRIGDRLKIGTEMGDVEDINLRHTTIRTWDNRRLIIPNSVISEREIINYSIKEERMLSTIDIGVSYDSDIDKAKKIMESLANKHPDIISPEIKDDDGHVEKKVPRVRVTSCGDFSVNLRLYFWVEKPGKSWTVGYDLLEEIKKEFDKQDIEIPFPYRTIVYKKDIEQSKKDKRKK